MTAQRRLAINSKFVSIAVELGMTGPAMLKCALFNALGADFSGGSQWRYEKYEGDRNLMVLPDVWIAPLNDARRVSRKELSKVEVARIVRICEEWQWLNEAEKISMYPHAIEQESVLPRESHYSSVTALLHGSAVTVSSSP